jgi:amino-acid N-acetyltransferase
MTELALAEALLDLGALLQVGVRVVVISTGNGEAEISQRLVDGELKWGFSAIDTPEHTLEVLNRGQLVLIDVPGAEPLADRIISFGRKLGASKLITLLDHPIRSEGMSLHAVSRETARNWEGDRKSLFAAAAEACDRGIPRIHLLDASLQGVLMDELFSNEGVGVMIHSDDYLSIRPITSEDIPELLAMIGRSIRDAFLVPRSYEEIESSLDEFLVLTIDDNVVGCIALHQYKEGCGEVACLYVKQNHGTEGYGRLLVQAAEMRAKELGLASVFALSTRAVDYFTEQLGYQQINVSEIPESRQIKLRESSRGSLVIQKEFD